MEWVFISVWRVALFTRLLDPYVEVLQFIGCGLSGVPWVLDESLWVSLVLLGGSSYPVFFSFADRRWGLYRLSFVVIDNVLELCNFTSFLTMKSLMFISKIAMHRVVLVLIVYILFLLVVWWSGFLCKISYCFLM